MEIWMEWQVWPKAYIIPKNIDRRIANAYRWLSGDNSLEGESKAGYE